MGEVAGGVDDDRLAALLQGGLSGSVRITPEELLSLVDYSLARHAMVHTIEAFELKDGLEYARTDLSLYGPSQEAAGMDWQKRAEYAADETRQIVGKALSNSFPIIFQIWLERE